MCKFTEACKQSQKLIQLYRQQSINGTFWLVLLLILLQTNHWAAQSLAGNQSFQLLTIKNSYATIIVGSIIIFICALMVNNICNRYRLTESFSNLPAALIILFSGFLLTRFQQVVWMPVLVLTVFIMNKLYKAYQKNKPEPNYFDVAFLIGVLSIIHPPFVLLLLAHILAIFILSIAKLRYFALSFIGFFMPWALLYTGLFLTNNMEVYNEYFIIEIFNSTNFLSLVLNDFSASFIVMFLVAVLSFFYYTSTSFKLSHIQKPILAVASLFIIVVSLIILLFLPEQQKTLTALIIPLAILATYYFFGGSKILVKFLFLLLIIVAFSLPWMQYVNIKI